MSHGGITLSKQREFYRVTEGSTNKDFIAKNCAKPDLAYIQALGSIHHFSFHHSSLVDIVFHSVCPASSTLTVFTNLKGRIENCLPLKFQAPVRLMSLGLKCCVDYPSHDEFQSNLGRTSHQLSLSVKQ